MTSDGPIRRALAIDAGGSRTKALVAEGRPTEPHQTILRREGPSGNIMTRGVENALAEVDTVLGHLQHDGLTLPVDVALIAMAGAGDNVRRAAIANWAAQRELAERIIVLSDAELVLEIAECASPENAIGMALIAGTGSIAMSRRPDLGTVRAGGWGPVLGDDGGGHWLGRQAIRFVLAQEDLEAATGEFEEQILNHYRVDDGRGLIAHIHAADHPITEIASAARVVLLCADNGERTALSLVSQAARELTKLVKTILYRLGDSESVEATVACSGGLLHTESCLLKMIAKQLERDSVELISVDDPVEAAAQLALMMQWDDD